MGLSCLPSAAHVDTAEVYRVSLFYYIGLFYYIHSDFMPSCTVSHIIILEVCTGWQRLTGCPKLQVTLRKRITKYRALLRKKTYKSEASYGSSPPCMCYIRLFIVYVEI